MQAKSLGFRSFIHCTIVTIFCLCLLSSTIVQAQKTPSIFKTEGGDKSSSLSATNMGYVNELEREYKRLESSDGEKAKIIRNKLIFIGVEQVDAEFNNYRKKSRKRNDLLQFIFDFLEIGASTAIALTGGERVKEVIAEALTGFKASRTAFNKNFKLLELQILFNKMVSKRSQRLSAIYEKLNQDVTSYPWERARIELRDYFFAGTIDEALSSLNIDTGSEARTEQQNLEDIKIRAGIVGAPTQAEITESKANFVLVRKITTVGDVDDAIQAQKNITPQTAATAAEITRLQGVQKGVLDDYRALFDVIQADAKLKPLLDQIPMVVSDGDPDVKGDLEASLDRLKKNDNPTLLDYDSIFLGLSDVISKAVSRDPSLGGRLQTILMTSKTLKK
jgi:hypothetical protein